MVPVVGWVSRIKGSELEIRLQTGPVFVIERRNDLHLNESVRVFYDYKRKRPGQVLSLNQLATMSEVQYDPWTEEDHPWDESDHWEVATGM